MYEIQFIKMLRNILQDTLTHCEVHEFNEAYIMASLRTKLSTLKLHVESFAINSKHKLKYYKVLKQSELQYINPKHREIMAQDLKRKLLELPSTIDFIKMK